MKSLIRTTTIATVITIGVAFTSTTFAQLTFGREKLRDTSKATNDIRAVINQYQSHKQSQPAPQNQAVTYSLSKESQTFVAHGGSGGFSVTTASTAPLTMTSNADWVTIMVPVQFSVEPNTTSTDRECHITVGDKVFKVIQSGTASRAAPASSSPGKPPTKPKPQ